MQKHLKATCTLGILLASTASSYGMNCDLYASEAARHQQLNESLQCGYTGDRWHNNSASHHIWCTFTNDRQRQAHHNYRVQKVDECKLVVVPGKVQVVPAPQDNKSGTTGGASSSQSNKPVAKGISALWCNNWAHNQADLAIHYADKGCYLSGDQSQNAHYNFCMTSTRDRINAKPAASSNEGNACLLAKQSAVSPNPPSGVNPPSSANTGNNLNDHCAAYTQEAWAVTSHALNICRNALSVPTTEAGIQNECTHIASQSQDLANIQGFIAGRMGLLRNIVNVCDRK